MDRNQILVAALALTPLARKVVDHLLKVGSVSAREAIFDLDITSASLSRRMTEIIRAGLPIKRERKKHPITGKPYTDYKLETNE